MSRDNSSLGCVSLNFVDAERFKSSPIGRLVPVTVVDGPNTEVGVHRGLLVGGVTDTADFDLLPLVPIATARAVASTI